MENPGRKVVKAKHLRVSGKSEFAWNQFPAFVNQKTEDAANLGV